MHVQRKMKALIIKNKEPVGGNEKQSIIDKCVQNLI